MECDIRCPCEHNIDCQWPAPNSFKVKIGKSCYSAYRLFNLDCPEDSAVRRINREILTFYGHPVSVTPVSTDRYHPAHHEGCSGPRCAGLTADQYAAIRPTKTWSDEWAHRANPYLLLVTIMVTNQSHFRSTLDALGVRISPSDVIRLNSDNSWRRLYQSVEARLGADWCPAGGMSTRSTHVASEQSSERRPGAGVLPMAQLRSATTQASPAAATAASPLDLDLPVATAVPEHVALIGNQPPARSDDVGQLTRRVMDALRVGQPPEDPLGLDWWPLGPPVAAAAGSPAK